MKPAEVMKFEPAERRRVAPAVLPPHERLAELVADAMAERDSDEQRILVARLIDALVQMRAPGDEAEEARVLLAHLDAKTLRQLPKDAEGRDAHTEAIETLLSLGFPHALNLPPEDLDLYREAHPSIGAEALAVLETRGYAAWLVIASQVVNLATAALYDQKAIGWALLAAVCGAMGAFWLHEDMRVKHVYGPMLLFLASLTMSVFLVPGVFSVMVGLVMAVALILTVKSSGAEVPDDG